MAKSIQSIVELSGNLSKEKKKNKKRRDGWFWKYTKERKSLSAWIV